MDVSIKGSGSQENIEAQVDPSNQALRVAVKPLEHNANQVQGGHYRVAARSGAVTGAAVVAGAPVFSFRWTDPTRLAVIKRVRAFWIPTVVFTAAQEIGLDLMHVTAFTAADSAVGTPVTPSKMRQTMPASQVNDCRIAAATLLTAGTRTLDANAICAGGGVVNVVNAAAATAYINPNSGGLPQYGFDAEFNPSRGEYPLVLGPNEGFLVRNTVIFPAAGTATLVVEAVWAETATY